MCIHGVRRSHTLPPRVSIASTISHVTDPIFARGFLLYPYIHIHIYIYFLNDIRNSHLRLPSGRCSVRCLAYMRVPPGANSSDIIVDVRDAHVALARSVRTAVKRALHHRAYVYVQPPGTARGSVGGSAWRHYGGVQRSSSGVEIARVRRRYSRRKAGITRSRRTQKRRRGEASISETFSSACAHRPLIKSLLNRITALPLAGHVAVISKHRFLPSSRLPSRPCRGSRNSRDKLYASPRLHQPSHRFHDRISRGPRRGISRGYKLLPSVELRCYETVITAILVLPAIVPCPRP